FIALKDQNEVFMLNANDAKTLFYFYDRKSLKIRASEFKAFYNDFIIPLMKKHPVNFEGVKVEMEEVDGKATPRVYVKEMDNFLLLIPAFQYQYDDMVTEVEMDNGEAIITE